MSENVKKEKKPGFFKGVKAEFKKITWPDKKSLFKQTIAVILVSLVVGLVIYGLDVAIKYVMFNLLANIAK